MKDYLISLVVLIFALSVGYWASKSWMPGANNEKAANFGVIPKTDDLGQAALPPRPASTPPRRQAVLERGFHPAPTSSGPGGDFRYAQGREEEARAINLEDPIERDQFAASLKQAGIPEEEISAVLEDSSGPKVSQEEGQNPEEAAAYNLNEPLKKTSLPPP